MGGFVNNKVYVEQLESELRTTKYPAALIAAIKALRNSEELERRLLCEREARKELDK